MSKAEKILNIFISFPAKSQNLTGKINLTTNAIDKQRRGGRMNSFDKELSTTTMTTGATTTTVTTGVTTTMTTEATTMTTRATTMTTPSATTTKTQLATQNQ